MRKECMSSGAIEIRPGVFACLGPALWMERDRSLLIADLHLGYAWAQRRRGQLGPLVAGDVRSRVEALLERFRPRRLVLLGDVVHAPRPCAEERRQIEESLLAFRSHCELVLVRGNHDRRFARDFGKLPLNVVDSFEGCGFVAFHGDSPRFRRRDGLLAVLGHWHPAVSVRDAAGAAIRYPAFLVWPEVIVLPAFSPFAAGLDIRRGIPEALRAIASGNQAPQYLVAAPASLSWLKKAPR